MSKKQIFINEVQDMINEMNYVWKNNDAKVYWDAFTSQTDGEKPLFTENGQKVLSYMQQEPDNTLFKSRDIGAGLFLSSRTVSGALRKLKDDGYVDKIDGNPVIYTLSSKGRNVKF